MKIRTAIIGLTACSGCQVQFLNIDALPEILDVLDITYFPLAKGKNSDGPFDLTLIEGCTSTPEQIDEIKKMREKTKTLVALGTCACFGGVNAMKNFYSQEKIEEEVYGGTKLLYKSIEASPISNHVKVDFCVPGCPFDKDGFLDALKSVVMDKKPPKIYHNVCAECKLKERGCLLEKKKFCMGPVVMGGCSALCPSYGYPCQGCRGPSEDAKAETLDTFLKILEDHGIPKEEIPRKFMKYAGVIEPFRRIIYERY